MASADDWVDWTDFPNNVVLAISSAAKNLQNMDPDAVFTRPLRPTDPGACIGVVASMWQPVEVEIGQSQLGNSAAPPGTSRYDFVVQSMIKHADEVLGLVAHAALSKRVRRMLDNQTPASLSLSQLQVTSDGTIERTLRHKITRQQFLANTISNSFLYVASLEFYLETETVVI